MKRILLAIGLLLFSAPLGAETVPTGVSFDVNPQEHGSSTVSGYKIYIVIGTNKVRVTDIGKPAPANGTIAYMDPALFTDLAPGTYALHATAYGPGGESSPSNNASFSVPDASSPAPEPPSNTQPIYDVPGAILVEAENFDGGNGYYDLTPENEGYAYRNTSVDVEVTSDEGGGYNVGWMAAGEWLKYTVDVPAAGTYELRIRVASPAPGGAFHIEVNGKNVTGPLQVPETGGWQVWTTLRRSGVELPAGPQVWRIVLDDEGLNWRNLVGNVNWIAAVPH